MVDMSIGYTREEVNYLRRIVDHRGLFGIEVYWDQQQECEMKNGGCITDVER